MMKERNQGVIEKQFPNISQKSFHHFRQRLEKVVKEYGASSVAGFISPDCSNEAAYLFQKFFRLVLDSNNIFTKSGPDVIGDPIHTMFTSTGLLTLSPYLDDIMKLDVIVVVQISPMRVRDELKQSIVELKQKGSKHIIWLGSEYDAISESSDLKVHIGPEGLSEILRAISWQVHLHGGTDRQVMWRDNSGFQQMVRELKKYELDEMASYWDIDPQTVKNIALLISRKHGVGFAAVSDNILTKQQAVIFQDVVNLVLMTGHFGKHGRGIYLVPPGKNSIGLALMGCSKNFLPGFLHINDPSAREWFNQSWNCQIPDKPGYEVTHLDNLVDTQVIRSVILLGFNSISDLAPFTGYTDSLSDVDLIVGAGSLFDERYHMWWPLFDKKYQKGSYIDFDRRLILTNDEYDASSYGYNDWFIVGQWLKVFNIGIGSSDHREIRNEIRENLPPILDYYNDNDSKISKQYFQMFLGNLSMLIDHEYTLDEIPLVKFNPITSPAGSPKDTKSIWLLVRKTKEKIHGKFTPKLYIHPQTGFLAGITNFSRFFIQYQNNHIEVIGIFSDRIAVAAGVLETNNLDNIMKDFSSTSNFFMVKIVVPECGESEL
ncbi:molybdopterin-dependent oxidoreductase [bacterium]|nr:molybdopterin-dependent oxidoreductase [candidate division CSSED10-310 bacterium]